MVKFLKSITEMFRNRKIMASLDGLSPAMRRDIGLPEDPGPPEARDYLQRPPTWGIGFRDWNSQ